MMMMTVMMMTMMMTMMILWCMLYGRYVGNAGHFSPIIRWQATLDFKDTSEDPRWSQQYILLFIVIVIFVITESISSW